MTQPLLLRDAVPADLALIQHFIRALAEYERLADQAKATDADLARFLFGTPRRAEALIAEQGPAPVGFALWYFGFSTFAGRPSLYVEDVFVEPGARGGGIGRAIFADLAARALAADCARMEWSVLDWNAPAIGFYGQIGARPREGWTLQRLTGPALEALAMESPRCLTKPST